jgi:hypothetical protein
MQKVMARTKNAPRRRSRRRVNTKPKRQTKKVSTTTTRKRKTKNRKNVFVRAHAMSCGGFRSVSKDVFKAQEISFETAIGKIAAAAQKAAAV